MIDQFRRWLSNLNLKSTTEASATLTSEDSKLISLTGRTIHKEVNAEVGLTILELAKKHKVDWSWMCSKGTCASCRCYVSEGMKYLSPPNEAELDRLDPQDIEEGYRLGCQTTIVEQGEVSVQHKSLRPSYF